MSDAEMKELITKIRRHMDNDIDLVLMDNNQTIPMMSFKCALSMARNSKKEAEYYKEKLEAKDREIKMLRESMQGMRHKDECSGCGGRGLGRHACLGRTNEPQTAVDFVGGNKKGTGCEVCGLQGIHTCSPLAIKLHEYRS